MPGPLDGVRVIELAGIGPAPFAGMLLADLGADVVRVDRAGPGSPLTMPPATDRLNRGKRSIALNLKNPQDLAAVRSLAARAHILIEGFRPGVAERLGVGPEELHARNPALVYGRMTGWGQDGPRAPTAGHDITYLALSGTLHALGQAGGPPQPPANLLGDFGGGALYLVVGVLAALRIAERTGEGQVVDAAIVDGSAHLATMLHGMLDAGLWQDRRGTNLIDTGAPFYAVFECADGGHVAVGALEPQFYATLVATLGLTGLPEQYDTGGWPELRRRLTAAFLTRPRDAWAALFAETDACVAPVLSLREAQADPHLTARATFVEHNGAVQPAPAPRFSATPAVLGGPPPVPGRDTDEILRDWTADA